MDASVRTCWREVYERKRNERKEFFPKLSWEAQCLSPIIMNVFDVHINNQKS